MPDLSALSQLEAEDNDEFEYDFERPRQNSEIQQDPTRFIHKGEQLRDLSIQLGSDTLPRFCCACHKNNIAVRRAINKDKSLPTVIKRLSAYSAKHKNSINRVKLSIKNKARLRIENATRWSSEYLVMESHHKAYKRNIFTEEYPCPVSFNCLEYYLQILLPAFQFNLIMQKTKSSIGDVLPSLNMMISRWTRMDVPAKYRILCNNLISAFKQKFSYEIDSPIYCVASLLNVSKLNMWQKRSDCAHVRKNGIENLTTVARTFLFKSKTLPDLSSSLSKNISNSSSIDSLNAMLKDDDYCSENEIGILILDLDLFK